MTPIETLGALIKLGTIMRDAVQKREDRSTADWERFLAGPEFQGIASEVAQLLGSLTKSDVEATITKLQKSLLGGRNLADLPTDKTLADVPTDNLLQCAELGNAKLALAAEEVPAAMNASFAVWLVDRALPRLEQTERLLQHPDSDDRAKS